MLNFAAFRCGLCLFLLWNHPKEYFFALCIFNGYFLEHSSNTSHPLLVFVSLLWLWPRQLHGIAGSQSFFLTFWWINLKDNSTKFKFYRLPLRAPAYDTILIGVGWSLTEQFLSVMLLSMRRRISFSVILCVILSHVESVSPLCLTCHQNVNERFHALAHLEMIGAKNNDRQQW